MWCQDFSFYYRKYVSTSAVNNTVIRHVFSMATIFPHITAGSHFPLPFFSLSYIFFKSFLQTMKSTLGTYLRTLVHILHNTTINYIWRCLVRKNYFYLSRIDTNKNVVFALSLNNWKTKVHCNVLLIVWRKWKNNALGTHITQHHH